MKLKNIIDRWNGCTDCKLARCSTKKVFYRGSAPCQILFVGEAPGKTEDALGEPFVGPSGSLLESLINYASRNIARSFTYGMTNVVACMPMELDRDSLEYGNTRPPEQEEIEACSVRLRVTIDAVDPKLIIAVGSVAHKALQDVVTSYQSIQHPSYILRQGGEGSLCFKKNALLLADEISKVFNGKEKKKDKKNKPKRELRKKQKNRKPNSKDNRNKKKEK